MELKKKETVICPICLNDTEGKYLDQDANEVQCPKCKQWFELGFQTHSGD